MASRFLIGSSQFPDPPKEKVVSYKRLSGGLNLRQLEYRLEADQSPEMKNLWWRDGLLSCRDGQEFVSPEPLGTGLCCYEGLFWGYALFHAGDSLYGARPGSVMTPEKLRGGLPEIRGTFLRYQDALLYKTKGIFWKITWDGSRLTVEDVVPYVPVTVINCTPDGAGDLYQPENRLSPRKTVWYSAALMTRGVSFTANGTATEFRFQTEDKEPVMTVKQVYVDTMLLDPSEYSVSEDGLTITMETAPAEGTAVSVVYTVGVRTYRLPVCPVDAIEQVEVDGETVTAYTADPQKGEVVFETAPEVQDPPMANTIRITYRKANPEGEKSIMDCCYGTTYGGTGGAVVVLAGSEAQPNAYFWNGGHVAMDPGYFPVSNYNLAGDNLEPVTGFGEQAGYLMVFKSHAVGRCQLGSRTIGERAYLTLDYTPINARLGCDLPWTIQLAENNLVWCSTYAGVCRMETTTAALENQVFCISRNVNGCDNRPGLLRAVREAKTVCSLSDGERYWLVAGTEAFLWDYGLSTAVDPSWFYFTNISAVDFFRGDSLASETDDGLAYTGSRQLYHLDKQGRVSRFVRTFRDYGEAIEKVYRFAVQTFGTYDRLKDVKKVVLATRSDTDTVIRLQYETDHQTRADLTPIEVRSWRLAPRNLALRCLKTRRFAHVAVRRPNCRHVRHFSLRLENREPGCDMSIVSAEFTAALVGRDR